MKKVLFGLVLAIGAMIALTACGGDAAKTPSDVTKAYYEALQNKNFDAAIDLCCTQKGEPLNADQKKTMKNMIETKANDDSQAFEKFEIVKEEIDAADATVAKVEVKKTLKNGEEKTETTNCKQVDGKWYVNSGK